MKCENCNKEHDGSYGSGRFCCKECARSYSTRNDQKGTKDGKCIVCGKNIKVDKRSDLSRVKCEDCKKIKICKICGQQKPCKRPDVCKKHNIFPTLEKYFGFDISKKGTVDIYEEFDRVRNILVEDYWIEKLSLPEMVNKYNHYNSWNFTKILKSLDIKTRNISESNINFYFQGKSNLPCNKQYKHGWHTTWNNKQIFYRSSYELEYAQYLDQEKINYEVEKLRILYWDSQRLMQRLAIPDFYLPDTGTIVEIKSNWTYDEQNMKDKFKSYKDHGYHCKLILDKEEVNL